MKITRIRDVKLPNRGTERSAGIDFYIPNDIKTNNVNKLLFIDPGEFIVIPSGIKVNIPFGYALIAHDKSGISTKKGLKVGAKVVDEDYQGEIHIHLINTSNKVVFLKPGDKVIQFLLLPVFYDKIEEVCINDLYTETTERGEGWAGSTD